MDNHSILGQTDLPQSITSLLSLALNGAHIPDINHTSVVLEILRVGANFCMDHGQQALDLLTPLLLISRIGRREPCSSSRGGISSGCVISFGRLCRKHCSPSKFRTVATIHSTSQINTDLNWRTSECKYWVRYVEDSIISNMLLNFTLS